jgi:hypothetical protein
MIFSTQDQVCKAYSSNNLADKSPAYISVHCQFATKQKDLLLCTIGLRYRLKIGKMI